MSDRPERVFAGLASKNPTEYVREDIVQEMLEQQREACGDAVMQVDEPDAVIFKIEAVRACINAVEKEV